MSILTVVALVLVAWIGVSLIVAGLLSWAITAGKRPPETHHAHPTHAHHAP